MHTPTIGRIAALGMALLAVTSMAMPVPGSLDAGLIERSADIATRGQGISDVAGAGIVARTKTCKRRNGGCIDTGTGTGPDAVPIVVKRKDGLRQGASNQSSGSGDKSAIKVDDLNNTKSGNKRSNNTKGHARRQEDEDDNSDDNDSSGHDDNSGDDNNTGDGDESGDDDEFGGNDQADDNENSDDNAEDDDEDNNDSDDVNSDSGADFAPQDDE